MTNIIGSILIPGIMGIASLGGGVPDAISETISEENNKNEEVINFSLEEDIKLQEGLVVSEQDQIPYNYEGYEPVKSEEEIKREEVLAKWQKKQNYLAPNLPGNKFTINASAYTASADECGNSLGITASGLKVKPNQTLACPPQYPFGTKVKIGGYGTYTCEDRGGAIKGNHFDIYMVTKKEAFAFGRRNLTAEVVE